MADDLSPLRLRLIGVRDHLLDELSASETIESRWLALLADIHTVLRMLDEMDGLR